MKFQKILMTFLITGLCMSVGYASPPTNDKAKFPTLVESYTSQIGVREATGNNDGKAVEMYLKTVGLDKGYPWCAAFVKWNLVQCNISNTINGMALSCHNKNNVVYEKNHFIKDPEPGDVFTLFYPKLGRIGHTGFFDEQINSSIYKSVEGNTNEAGSREGDGVFIKYRSYNATYSITRWR